jgi:hypothetical protein
VLLLADIYLTFYYQMVSTHTLLKNREVSDDGSNPLFTGSKVFFSVSISERIWNRLNPLEQNCAKRL